jgi:hypothetical protein
MITINIAFTDADGLVKDDYYKEGLAINRDIARKQMAEDLGVTGQVSIDIEASNIQVVLNDAAMGQLDKILFKMIHPTRADNDFTIELERTNPRTYQGKLLTKINPGNWWVRVSPINDSWYIEGRIELPKNKTLQVK